MPVDPARDLARAAEFGGSKRPRTRGARGGFPRLQMRDSLLREAQTSLQAAPLGGFNMGISIFESGIF